MTPARLALVVLLSLATGAAARVALPTAEERDREAKAAGQAARLAVERLRTAEAAEREVQRAARDQVYAGMVTGMAILVGLLLYLASRWVTETMPARTRATAPEPFAVAWLGAWARRRVRLALLAGARALGRKAS